MSRPILCTPNFNKQFMLQTDASNFGIGAVLSQINDVGEEHAVGYLSRKLLSREERYSVPEKECLAIVWAIGKLRYYLYGRKFVIFTDHKSLSWLD